MSLCCAGSGGINGPHRLPLRGLFFMIAETLLYINCDIPLRRSVFYYYCVNTLMN